MRCQGDRPLHTPVVRLCLSILATGCLALLGGCSWTGSSTAGHPSDTGPFDSRGNYVEEWADSPSKWRRRSSQPTESQPGPDLVAKNDQIRVAPAPSRPQATPPVVTASRPSTPVAAKPKPSTGPTSASTTPKPKPKPVVSKPKPKKPAVTRVTIKKGDTLSGLARRYGTTVGAIKRANGMSGDMIRAGKTLVIPKK